MRILLIWLVNTIALLVLPYLTTSIRIAGFGTALVAALVLGLVNALIRPLLVLLTLPVTIVTLGVFILVINGLLFWLVSRVVEGFYVSGFWAAVGGALLYSIISWALSTLLFRN